MIQTLYKNTNNTNTNDNDNDTVNDKWEDFVRPSGVYKTFYSEALRGLDLEEDRV